MAEIGNVTVRVDAVITDEQYREAMGAVRAANERMDLLEAENAKLRELVRDYEYCSMHVDCGRCKYDGTTSTHCPFSPCFPDADELDEMVDASDSADDRCEKLADLADRIRKLAEKKEGK